MADFVNSAFNIELSLGAVAFKRKIEAQTKIATLNLPLLNKPQSTPKFACVSESEVGEEREPSKSQMANVSEFEASARALEGKVGRKEDKYKKQKITVIKFKNRDSPTQVCFAALAR